MKTQIIEIIKPPSLSELGFSMNAGIMPERIQENGTGEELVSQMGSPVEKLEYFYYFGSNGDNFNQHIDIVSHKYSLVYDLGSPRDIEKVFISCCYDVNINYTVGEFEIFASNCREDLFEDKNRIIYYDNRNRQLCGKARNNADFLFQCQDVKARFVAFRQLNTNSPDEFSRIKNICFFGEEFTKQRTYLADMKLNGSCISGLAPKFDERLAVLTDEVIFDDFQTAQLNSEAVKFDLIKPSKIDHVVVISKGDSDFEIFCDEKAVSFEVETENLDCGRMMYTADISDGVLADSLTLSFKSDATVDQILAYYSERTVKVEPQNIITEDFLGLGANVLPCHLFTNGRLRGFTEQHWELEKRRISVAAPKVVRVWFQLDWFIMTEQGYLNREYCFDTPKMRAFYKELDAFKENDVEVELNYGWKIGYDAQEWFSFPNIYNRKASAPKNLDAFATSCSDCLRELIINRGYDNIKYLSFYNEPNNGHIENDFVCPDDYNLLDYWKEMLEKCEAQLRRDGLRDLVKIWAAESNSRDNDRTLWPDYFDKNAADLYDYYCHHCYFLDYEKAIEVAGMFKKSSTHHPFIISEFGTHNYGDIDGVDFNFERTNQCELIAFMNAGMAGALFWVLSGCPIDEHVFVNGIDECFWQYPVTSGVNAISRRFYELSLFTNYIPRHSKVVYSSVSDDGMHAVAVKTPSGGYTVFVELRDGGKFDRTVNIDFGCEVNQKFYKHCYRLGCEREGNMIIPPVEREIEVGSTLTDAVDGSYALICYTTEPPKPQVVMENCEIIVKPGETVKLNARVIDGEGELKWSMPDCYAELGYRGTVTPDGVYTASEIHKMDRVECNVRTDYAVKAELPTGEYGIMIVKIRKYTTQ